MPALRLCAPDEVPALLGGALAGEHVLVPLPEGPQPAWLDTPTTPPEAAVVVTTSGSTGRPKGVCLPASALVASASAMTRAVGELDWWCSLPLHYVAGLMTLVRAEVAGTRWRQLDASLADLPSPERPTAISVVATQLHRALQQPATTARLARMAVVLVGGSAIPADLLQRAREAGVPVRTTYGMSETCGGCVHDGHPLPGVRVRCDETGRILLGGPMLFSGYWGNPELTAETLQDGWLVTQDRGRLDGDQLSVLGRLDDVVISGGVNVDLAEVQRLLTELAPGRAVVVGVPDPEWGTTVALATTGDDDVDAWRARLREHGLGAAALPRLVRRVTELPRTASGKVDRQRIVRLFTEGM